MLILGAETPSTTGIEAPVVERHLNVHTGMSATVADVEDLIDDPTATAHVFKESIFHLEALCVCAAFLHTIALAPAGTWNVVFTDNINTVQMFNSLTTLPSLNWMLKVALMLSLLRTPTFASYMSLKFTTRQPTYSPDPANSKRLASSLHSPSNHFNPLGRCVGGRFMIHLTRKSRQHIESRSVRTHVTGIVSELEPFYSFICEARNFSLVSRTIRGAMRRFSCTLRQRILLTRDDLRHVHGSMPRPLAHGNLPSPCCIQAFLASYDSENLFN